MNKIKFSFYILLIHSIASIAQTTGKVKLNISPNHAVVKINNELIVNPQDTLIMTFGTHTIDMWAPNLEFKSDTIIIDSSSLQVYSYGLKLSPEYKDYKEELKTYKRKRAVQNMPIILSSCYSIFGVIRVVSLNSKLKKEESIISASVENYNNALSINNITTSNNDYNTAMANYNHYQKKKKKMITNGVVLYSLSGIAYYVMKKKLPILEKPLFDDSIKLSLTDLNFSPYKNGMLIGLNFRL
jgi:hypothetical protein